MTAPRPVGTHHSGDFQVTVDLRTRSGKGGHVKVITRSRDGDERFVRIPWPLVVPLADALVDRAELREQRRAWHQAEAQ
ncbi:hypothetical protein [Williamsia deligens]|uniref:Uncharacterized protein n=1 Tax=Williamsia deligens TaxID=321325 RepID=A0ABW3GC51_9NOCA|nr:hypothetical protein [Williamsia deligens]